MERYTSSDSNISIDSLEREHKKKSSTKKKVSVDTILVPFYEKDVLIKVPKGSKSKNTNDTKNKNVNNKVKKEPAVTKNYLVNKEVSKKKQTSYLEMFRKQFIPAPPTNKSPDNEIRSISPEFGDTERETFRDEVNSPATDFYNSESYNEIYYDKLMNKEINTFIEQAYAEQLAFTDNIRTLSPDEVDENNLRSISDVSQPRRSMRRATIQPLPSVKLGGLGPDMENIRPRLERARSLQRYSEKVRMENRVKIYKKSVQEEIEKKAEKEAPLRRQESAKSKEAKANENFLVNKNAPDKKAQPNRRICYSKCKSANVKQTRYTEEVHDKSIVKDNYNGQNAEKKTIVKKLMNTKREVFNKERFNSSATKGNEDDPVVNKVQMDGSVPPVQISFLVNMGGLRPSTALRTLEAKHRMYQEKVKEFTINNNNDIDSDNNK